MATIMDLPDCLLTSIFQTYFETVNETNNLRLVCQRWNQLIVNFWSKIDKFTMEMYIKDPELFLEFASCIAKRHPRIKEISIEPIEKIGSLHHHQKVPNHYHIIGKIFPGLEKITFHETYMEDDSLVSMVKNCPKLWSLSFFDCEEIDDKIISPSIRDNPQIKELQIFGCSGIEATLAADCLHLSSLAYESCPFESDDWSALAEAGGKENLKKLITAPFNYDILCLMSRSFPNLREFYINEFDEGNFAPINYHGFPSLETLTMTYGSVSDDTQLMQIISECPKLINFWIWSCASPRTTTFINKVLKQHKNTIEHLIIDSVKTGELQKMDLSNFSNLKKITLIGTILNNNLIQRIIDACPKLSHLDIADCQPSEKVDVKATYIDFWLNTRPLDKIPPCCNTDPPFRFNYKNASDFYEGPVLELSCGNKKPAYRYKAKC